MAIQLPNPGLGDGQTGDNEFVMWTKTKDNFNNQRHAASRLVGVGNGNLAEYTGGSVSGLGYGGDSASYSITSDEDLLAEMLNKGTHFYRNTSHTSGGNKLAWPNGASVFVKTPIAFMSISAAMTGAGVKIATGDVRELDSISEVTIHTFSLWTDKNTKLDTNGALAPSSPTIDLYSDRIETNSDGARMNPEFVRNGVGDYTIKNTTGLRDEGWYIKIPNDKYGNPKVLADIEQADNGDLSIKTYGRKFDYEVAGVVPDLDNPLDIPEGRWIDLRFNDLPFDDDKTEV